MDITQYIQQRRSMGASDAQIRQELLASGWQPAALDQAFALLVAPGSPMPLQPFATTQSDAIRERRVSKKLVAFIAIGLVIMVVGLVMFWPKAAQKTQQASNKLAHPALQQSQSSTTRKIDVQKLIASITTYQSNNNGTLPVAIKVVDTHTVRLCDSQCTNAAAVDVVFDSDASGVELHSYSDDVRVPNEQAVYVIPGATCNQERSGVMSSTPRAFAVLYGVIASDSTSKQECAAN